MMQKKEKTPQTAATAQGENQNMQIKYISENFDCQAPGITIKSLTTEQVEKIHSQLPQLLALLEEPYRSEKPW